MVLHVELTLGRPETALKLHFRLCTDTRSHQWGDKKHPHNDVWLLLGAIFFKNRGEAKEQAEQLADAQLDPQGGKRAPGKLVKMQRGRTQLLPPLFSPHFSSWISIVRYLSLCCEETGRCCLQPFSLKVRLQPIRMSHHENSLTHLEVHGSSVMVRSCLLLVCDWSRPESKSFRFVFLSN